MSSPRPHPDLEPLIKRWRGPLVGLLLARGLDRGTAHDLAEEVFVEAWLSFDQGRFRGDPGDVTAVGTWLRGIARNLAAAWLRRRRRTPRTADPTTLESVPRGATRGTEPSDLRLAIDRLPRSLREVVLVRYLDEQTGAEAAALLGLTEKAVERRSARARAQLRE
ncbi:MAG: RNA polymerase sigma factor [Planctomycetota bacterium]